MHNRLAALMAAVLVRWRRRYAALLAYVAPGLTHRSFLGDTAERRAAGLPAARRAGRRLPADVLTRPWCLRLLLDRLHRWTPP
jgi:hypothetical protein